MYEAAKAPHPDAAALLLEHLTGPEGQKVIARGGTFPAILSQVQPEQAPVLEVKQNFLLISPDMAKEQDEADQTFRELFWPKTT